jgi:hypothetical protein
MNAFLFEFMMDKSGNQEKEFIHGFLGSLLNSAGRGRCRTAQILADQQFSPTSLH